MGRKQMGLTVLTALIALIAAVGTATMAEEVTVLNGQMDFLASPAAGH